LIFPRTSLPISGALRFYLDVSFLNSPGINDFVQNILHPPPLFAVHVFCGRL
jgi:hypothetical protein